MKWKSSLFTERIASILENIANMTSAGSRPPTLAGLRKSCKWAKSSQLNYAKIILMTYSYDYIQLRDVGVLSIKNFFHYLLTMALYII